MGWDFSKGSAYSVTDPKVSTFQNVGYHLGLLMTEPAPARGSFAAVERVYHYRIEPAPPGLSGEAVWDQVFLRVDNGPEITCGNRCGGCDTLAALYAEEMGMVSRP